MTNKEFFKILVDPITKESLVLQADEEKDGCVWTGNLSSSTGVYPVVRGIPRFVSLDGGYSENFGIQWKKWARVQFESFNKGKSMEGHTTKMFDQIMGLPDSDFADKVILDIGCGAGRFIDVAKTKGAIVVGIDYSEAADVSRRNHKGDPNVFIVQGDALNLPFRSETFDGVYSIGVLHHTPEPYTGVSEGYSCLKSDGWLAIAVYEGGKYYGYKAVNFWRWVFRKLWPFFKEKPALIYTYIVIYGIKFSSLGLIPKISKGVSGLIKPLLPNVWLSDLDWSLLDTFDSITTSYQSTHTEDEVIGWYNKLGLKKLNLTKWGVSIVGYKK